jgi:predicted RNA binding protein YcfA (HicA-like mRNA interferase family)
MSPKLPHITANALLRALRQDGWESARQSGSHLLLKHPVKSRYVIVPRQSGVTIKAKTLATILKQAGLTVDELSKLL